MLNYSNDLAKIPLCTHRAYKNCGLASFQADLAYVRYSCKSDQCIVNDKKAIALRYLVREYAVISRLV